MKKKIPVYECKVRDTDNTGIFAMSFVEVPAVEKNFVALKAAQPVKLKLDKVKQILTGVVLIPNKLIYRNDHQLGEYYLKYTAPDIERIQQKMMKQGVALSSTTHQHEKPLKGNHLVECWIITDPKNDKANALGMGELPKGTLMASYHVEDKKYWRNEVMTGNVLGFSLEGLFNYNRVNMKKTALTPAKAKQALAKTNPIATMFKSLAAMLEGDTAAETKDLATVAADDEVGAGDPFIIFTLEDGNEIFCDAEGFCTIDEEQAPAGEHMLEDGSVIVIDDAGSLVETKEEAEVVEDEVAPAALAAAKEMGTKMLALMKANGGKMPTADQIAKLSKKAPAAAKPAAQKVALTGNAKKIADLEAQLAAAKKLPTAKPAAQKVEGVDEEVDLSKLSPTEKIAHVIKMRRERAD